MMLPNLLSMARIPLALVFIIENPWVRCFAIAAAMLTDFLDGYLARRLGKMSRLGTVLDPVGDKFFVLFVFYILISEGKLTLFHALEMLSRDWAIIIFGLYVVGNGVWGPFKIRSFWCGKITTAFQFIVLIVLTLGLTVPAPMYAIFVALGLFSLPELWYLNKDLGVKMDLNN